jgi:dipeptidyl aminopeptidase/acylaminoacyl peptidase
MPVPRPRRARRLRVRARLAIALASAAAAAACGGGGGGSSSPIAADVPPELLAGRARVDDSRFAEIALRDARNLGTRRLADRSGIERGVRVHPDGNTLVFARKRDPGDADSTELFLATIDGSTAEVRLTQNTVADDAPCWSPDGTRILFASERSGRRQLWTIARDGNDAQPFVTSPDEDGEPDWHRGSGRIVWSRRDASDGRHRLLGASASGVPDGLVTEPIVGAGFGDVAPRFGPDGMRIVFVRRTAAERATLCRLDVASGSITELVAAGADVATPCIAPAGDQVFFGLAEADVGRATLRLASVPLGGGPTTLLWPDERWRLEGLELLPSLPPAPPAGTPLRLDVTQAQLQVATATSAFGDRVQLAEVDGEEYALTTATVDGREIAGISLRFDVPVAAPEDVLAYDVRIVARASRAGAGSVLRSSLYNPVEERFDTVVELEPSGTGAQTLTFRAASLRHLTRERQLRVTVIADLAPGPRAELHVDLVEVVVTPRAP